MRVAQPKLLNEGYTLHGCHSEACGGTQAHQASQLVDQGLDAPAPPASRRPISASAASARLLWQAALHFITLSQLRQVGSRPQLSCQTPPTLP